MSNKLKSIIIVISFLINITLIFISLMALIVHCYNGPICFDDIIWYIKYFWWVALLTLINRKITDESQMP